MIESAAGSATVEPLVMQLLLVLSRRAGQLVSRREIFEWCWGSSPAGDDSLNRLVALLRKALYQAAGSAVVVETVAGAGYLLRLTPPATQNYTDLDLQSAISAASDSWRLGWPEPDHIRIEMLRAACSLHPENAQAWGWLALLCRHAAEYAEPNELSAYVAECEAAARRALAIEPNQTTALAALAGVAPLFGRWEEARRQLQAVLEAKSGDSVATHDLAIVEMASGRVAAAKQLMDGLLAADPLAACYCYKSVYQHWSVGALSGMDHVADRAVQLWPMHPAVWTARLWTLAYTGRATASLDMLGDTVGRPQLPSPMLIFLRQVLTAAASRSPPAASAAIQASKSFAAAGPAQAIAGLFALGLLSSCDEIFDVAEAYYLRKGASPVPVQQQRGGPSINDQHRRVTQILFTPVFAEARSTPRFTTLCDRIGLTRYWETTGLRPDFALS